MPSGAHSPTLRCSLIYSSYRGTLIISVAISLHSPTCRALCHFFIIIINSLVPCCWRWPAHPLHSVPAKCSLPFPHASFFHTLMTPLGLWGRMMGRLGQAQQTSLKVASTSRAPLCISSPAADNLNAPLQTDTTTPSSPCLIQSCHRPWVMTHVSRRSAISQSQEYALGLLTAP